MKRFLTGLVFIIMICLVTACDQSESPVSQNVIYQERFDATETVKDVQPSAAEIKNLKHELTEEQKAERIPTKVLIPAINIVAPIEPVGLDSEGRVDTIPNALTVAWYKYGAAPGSQGNAILAGHRDWNGTLGSLRSIEDLKIGEAVTITFKDGSEQSFKVVSNNTYLMDEVPEGVMSLEGESRITMITCSGKFVKEKGGYQNRVVVVLE